MNLSKFVISADSYDMKFGLLYNKKNGYFVRYEKSMFKDIGVLLQNKQVIDFLKNKDFFDIDELSYIEKNKKRIIESKDELFLIIKVTRECNFRCTYCYEEFPEKRMDLKNAKKLLNFIWKFIRENDIKRLIISWFGGEPTCNIDIIDYICKEINKMESEKRIDVIYSIVTNGYNLDKSLFDFLIGLGIKNFKITIDGCRELHDKQRITKSGQGTFDVIVNNVKNMISTSHTFNTIIRINVDEKVLEKFETVERELLEIIKLDSRFTIDIHKIINYSDFSSCINDDEILELFVSLCNKGYKIIDQRVNLSPHNAVCYASKKNNFVIDSDCRVSKCTVCNNKFSYVGMIDDTGNLIYNNNINIWMDKNYEYFDKCKNCENYANCFGVSCPLHSIISDKPCCKSYKGKDDVILKILNLQNKYNLTIGGRYVE